MIESSSRETQRALLGLLRALEAHSTTSTPQPGRRKEPRKTLHAPCELTLFKGRDAVIWTVPATVRNVAFAGMSIVAPLPGPLRNGRPLEAVVEVPARPRLHAAGRVAFCRRVTEQCFEVGVEVLATAECPILRHDVAITRELYDWFEAALAVPE